MSVLPCRLCLLPFPPFSGRSHTIPPHRSSARRPPDRGQTHHLPSSSGRSSSSRDFPRELCWKTLFVVYSWGGKEMNSGWRTWLHFVGPDSKRKCASPAPIVPALSLGSVRCPSTRAPQNMQLRISSCIKHFVRSSFQPFPLRSLKAGGRSLLNSEKIRPQRLLPQACTSAWFSRRASRHSSELTALNWRRFKFCSVQTTNEPTPRLNEMFAS